MENIKNVFIIVFLLIILTSTSVFATEFDENEETNLDNQGIIEADQIYIDDNIKIDRLIDGNVIAIGKNVVLDGAIARDLYVIAENFTINESATVYGNVYILASNAKINGGVYQIYGACDNIEFDYYGQSQSDIKIMAKEISIDGIIGRNAYINADKILIEKDGNIKGNLVYTSKTNADYEEENGSKSEEIPQSVVNGKIEYTQRNDEIFNKTIKESVKDILKELKDLDEEELETLILSKIFSDTKIGINDNKYVEENENEENENEENEIKEDVIKNNIQSNDKVNDSNEGITISNIQFYIYIAVLAILAIIVVILIIVLIIKTKK